MSDPLRTDTSRALDVASDLDRDAKIEQLLLVGLDHYFSAEYEHAVNVWTRVLFLDRSHAKAHAYIERARSALAERQRESEELLQHGVAAFQRGDADEARRLLQTAISRGAPPEEALAVLDRLNRLEPGTVVQRPPTAGRRGPLPVLPGDSGRGSGAKFWMLLWLLAFTTVVGGIVVVAPTVDWRSLLAWDEPSPLPVSLPAADSGLPLPRRGEAALARARTFSESGHLREALVVLDAVSAADPQRPEADQLRARIQHELIALMSTRAPEPVARGKSNGYRP